MTYFGAIELRDELADAVRANGWDAPTSLQEAAFAILRRGGNALLRGSPGSGLVGAYGLPLLDGLIEVAAGDSASEAGTPGSVERADSLPRILVLTATPDRAEHVARALSRLGSPAGVRVAALAPGWSDPAAAAVVVADAGSAAAALGRSRLKLDAVSALVVEGVQAMADGLADALEGVVAALPAAAQRVVTSADESQAARDLGERLAPKAIGIPPRSELEPAGDPAVTVLYAVLPEAQRPAALARLVADAPAGVVAHCRSAARAAGVASALRARGFPTEVAGAGVRLRAHRAGADDAPADGAAGGASAPVQASYDAPPDPATFAERHSDGGMVFLAARELTHAQRAAAAAGLKLAPAPADAAASVEGELGAFRERVERALREEDIAAQTLVLAPLVEEHGALPVAAALSALARARASTPPSRPDTAGQREARPAVAAGTPGAAPAPAPTPAFTRLFISVGKKDGAGPGDIVGAIAGETGVAGERIGRIELAETHAIAEVATEDARRVIDALNGTTIRGRAVRVDFDRPRRARPDRRARGPRPG